MQRHGSFSQAENAGKKKQTRRDKACLGEGRGFWRRWSRSYRGRVWWGACGGARVVEGVWPFYPKGERGRPPIGLERMLRIHFLRRWYGLAGAAREDALYDSQALRGFAGIDLRWRRSRTRRQS